MNNPVFVMTTDHGTHSADTWADMLSQMMFPISADIAQNKLLQAKSTQLAIANSISQHAQTILDRECKLLSEDSDARFDEDHDGHEFVEDAVADILKAVEGTPWAEQLHAREDALRNDLAMHFHHMQSVERMHHSDHNPSDKGDAYKDKIHGRTGV